MKYIIIISIIALQGCVGYKNYKFTEEAKLQQQPLVVKWLSPSLPNSAGGVNLHPNIENISDKTIKYLDFTVTPFNSVGDQAYSEIRNESTKSLRMTGPYKSGYDTTGFFESFTETYFANTWYNYQIRCVEIDDITITFMDGASIYYDKSNLKLIVSQLKNCKGQINSYF